MCIRTAFGGLVIEFCENAFAITRAKRFFQSKFVDRKQVNDICFSCFIKSKLSLLTAVMLTLVHNSSDKETIVIVCPKLRDLRQNFLLGSKNVGSDQNRREKCRIK